MESQQFAEAVGKHFAALMAKYVELTPEQREVVLDHLWDTLRDMPETTKPRKVAALAVAVIRAMLAVADLTKSEQDREGGT